MASSARAGTSSGRFSACASAAPPQRRATAVRRRRPGIWIGTAFMHHSEIKADVRKLIADGTVHPRASARARRQPRARRQASARTDALLYRCRRRRTGRRRPHHAIRDPRRRPVPAGAGAGGGDGGKLDQTAARDGRRPGGPDPTGHCGSANRARHRLSRRPAQPRGDEVGFRRRDHRALRGGGARNPAGRLLPAAGGRRRHPRRQFLAPLCGHRQRHRHQDRAVQPLPNARRAARRGGGRRARPRRALYRQ